VWLVFRYQDLSKELFNGVGGSAIQQLLLGFLENVDTLDEAVGFENVVPWNLMIKKDTLSATLESNDLTGYLKINGGRVLDFSLRSPLELRSGHAGEVPLNVKAHVEGAIGAAFGAFLGKVLKGYLLVTVNLAIAGTYASQEFSIDGLLQVPLDWEALPEIDDLVKRSDSGEIQIGDGLDDEVAFKMLLAGLQRYHAERKFTLQLDETTVSGPLFDLVLTTRILVVIAVCGIAFVLSSVGCTYCMSYPYEQKWHSRRLKRAQERADRAWAQAGPTRPNGMKAGHQKSDGGGFHPSLYAARAGMATGRRTNVPVLLALHPRGQSMDMATWLICTNGPLSLRLALFQQTHRFHPHSKSTPTGTGMATGQHSNGSTAFLADLLLLAILKRLHRFHSSGTDIAKGQPINASTAFLKELPLFLFLIPILAALL
jgi:hypothetical protein